MFAVRYGYTPVVVPLHVAQVALGCICLGAAVRGMLSLRWLERRPRRQRAVATAVAGAGIFGYMLVIVLSTITNEAWGWSISFDMARAFAPHVGTIAGNLPVWHGWVAVGVVLFDVIVGVLTWMFWRAAPSVLAVLQGPVFSLRRAATGAIILLAFVAWARTSPRAAAEPFTAFFTAPGEATIAKARDGNRRARG